MNRDLKITLAVWPALTLVATAICFLTDFVASLFGINLPPQPSLEAVLNSQGWRFVANIAMIVAIMPAVEEFIFRFLLYRLPSRVCNNVATAIASSVLFSATHYIQMPFPNNAFVALFAFGMIQCALYKKTGKVWSVILTHALFNSTNLALLFIFPELAKAS